MRVGGESGVRAVTMLEGDDVWRSLHRDPAVSEAGKGWAWPTKLIDAAIGHGQQTLVRSARVLLLRPAVYR